MIFVASFPFLPPHLLPAESILAAHLAPPAAAQRSQLNARLQTVQAHNARLHADIARQRGEIEALLAGVERVLADMGGASALMDAVVEDLRRETREAELDMAGP
ncbi:hypothetical protein P8C59_003057 [Phyllachora maydis]|uniref:Uncharacterized protein n=1 Tax=Phyllachora maydis TaxID=1825666 RepID=A0AAD9HZN5_9PEZI|nr:hypothetical protein P8C59_003057 [Phyllachora maydis]